MTLRQFLMLYPIAVLAFFAIDMVWLGWLATDFYQVHLGHLLAAEVDWIAAGVFYVAFIAGILLFAVRPAVQAGSLRPALLWGALFGMFTYGTYELTNRATLPDWPVIVVVVDIVWGTVLCASVAAVTYWVGRRLGWVGFQS